MEKGLRRNEPANKKAAWVITKNAFTCGLQDATERFRTKIVSWQLGARCCSDSLRCLCRKLAGGERCDIWKERGREGWRISEFDIRGDCSLGELRKLWGYLEAEEWLGWLHEPQKSQETSHSHEHTMIQKGALTWVNKNMPLYPVIWRQPQPQSDPLVPISPLLLSPLDSDTNDPAEDRGSLNPYIT